MKLYGNSLFTLVFCTLAALSAQAAETTDASQFMETVARGSTAEIAIGQMAESRAKNEQVRAFAARMVQDHSKALEQARQVADEMGAPIETGMPQDKQQLAEQLTAAQGEQFDRTYMQAMVDSHKKTVANFERQAQQGDNQAAQFASQQLPVLKEHLAMAEAISGQLKQSGGR